MNQAEYERYFSLRLRQFGILGGLNSDAAKDLIKLALRVGLADLWHAKRWTFRRRELELTIGSEAERYELQKDVCAIMVPREKSSTYGKGLIYVSKDEFDRINPRPVSHSGGVPQLCTMYQDGDNKYIQFFPPPNITPVYLSYLVDTPATLDHVPDVAQAALVASIAKYVYEPGSAKYLAADAAAEKEIAKLEVQDSPYAEEMWRFFDDTDRQIGYYPENWPW